MNCRFCDAALTQEFLDLGCCPPSNSFLSAAQLNAPEIFYPLKLWVCGQCLLVQVEECKASAEIFSSEYVYFSSFSSSWLAHARAYVEMIAARLDLGPASQVVEIAANDGYLLQYVRAKSIPCYGVEPSAGVAQAARDKGLRIVAEFFGEALAERLVQESGEVDLLIGNNVLAHVPDVRDFTRGICRMLKTGGVATLEFPHLLRLVEENQFDTVYHEHFSYFSLATVRRIFAASELRIFDVEELPTHGGSLRIYAGRSEGAPPESESVRELLAREGAAGMGTLNYYRGFQARADRVKHALLSFLLEQKRKGRSVVGYGAAAKGNTLLNYAGVKPDLLPFVVDASPHKRGMYLPGSRIPVLDESRLRAARPDFVLVLPWNLKDEIKAQLAYIGEWGGRFLIPVPAWKIEDPPGERTEP